MSGSSNIKRAPYNSKSNIDPQIMNKIIHNNDIFYNIVKHLDISALDLLAKSTSILMKTVLSLSQEFINMLPYIEEDDICDTCKLYINCCECYNIESDYYDNSYICEECGFYECTCDKRFYRDSYDDWVPESPTFIGNNQFFNDIYT
jgi:hypothetical protein